MPKSNTKTRPLTPLQAMIKNRRDATTSVQKKEDIQVNSKQKITEHILIVDPHIVQNWKLADRPEAELTSVKELAKEFTDPNIGQKIPCTVREINETNSEIKYEIITGEQRWRAAKLAGTKLKIIVRNLTDKNAAIEQILENRRDNLSDYAQGMSFSRLIKENLLKQKDLESIIGKPPVAINRLLSFSQVPNQVWEAMDNLTKVSARTASEIRAILKKKPALLNDIIALAPQIAQGKIGAISLKNKLSKVFVNKSTAPQDRKEIRNKTGRHLFSWRNDSNGNTSISFPKDIRTRINKEALEILLINEIDKQLSE